MYSPPAPTSDGDTTVTVRVALISVDGKAAYAACATPAACQFSYRLDSTPTVDFLSLGGAPGQTLRVTGRLFGLAPDDYSIRVGDMSCSLDEDEYDNPAAIIPSSTRYGSVRCEAGGPQVAGRYNVSVRVRDGSAVGYGEALLPTRAQGVEPGTGRLHSFTVHPLVTGLSHNATGLGGGAPLTLTGSGFTWDAARVTVELGGGVPCEVTHASPTELRCVPGPAAAPTAGGSAPGVFYPGGRGLLTRVWGHGVYSDAIITAPPSITSINTDSLQGARGLSEFDYYVQEQTGFFVPPVSANYSFWVRGDDRAAVFLSTDASPARAARVAYTDTFVPSWAVDPAAQQSAPVALEGGRPYWFAVRHVDYSANDFLDVGLRVHLDGNAPAQALFGTPNHRVHRSVPEHQQVSITTVVVREVQAFTVSGAASGTFTLAIGGSMRTDALGAPLRLPLDASPDAVAAFVRGGVSCGNIGVTRARVPPALAGGNSSGFTWNVTFGCPTDAATWPAIVPYSVTLAPAPGGGEVELASVRRVAPSRPAGGFFRLAYNGTVSSVTVPARADGWQLRAAALQVLPPGARVEAWDSWTERMDGGSWQLAIYAPFGDLPLLEVVTVNAAATPGVNGSVVSTLTGAGVSATVTERVKGSTDALLWPVPMEYFRVPQTTTAGVSVTVDGIVGACAPSNTTAFCTYAYLAAKTPTVTGVSATSVTAGDVLVITGTGFAPASAGVGRGVGGTDLPPSALNAVFLGGSAADVAAGAVGCNVTLASATSLTCTVLNAVAGTYALRVVVLDGARGAALPAANASALPTVTYTGRVAAIDPPRGSTAGGTALVVSGTGFFPAAANNTVLVGGQPCAVEQASTTRLVCRTPPAGASGGAVLVNGLAAPADFVYDAVLTAELADLAPRALSSGLSGTLTLSLRNMGGAALAAVALIPASYNISFGGRACAVINVTAGAASGAVQLNCSLVRGNPGPLPQAPLTPRVVVAGFGYAAVAPGVALDAPLRVDALSTATGSLAGGTLVNLTGAGFSPRLFQVEVEFVYLDQFLYDWLVPANVTDVAADGTWVAVVVPAVPLWKRGRANSTVPQAGALRLRVNNITAPCAPATSGCAFTQAFDYTPTVDAATASADGVTLTGAKLSRPGARTTLSLGVSYTGLECSPPGSATSLSCALPRITAGTYDVNVHVAGWGIGRSNATLTVPLLLDAWPVATPARGSLDGGLRVVLSGSGFATDDLARNIVRFGAFSAVVLAATPTTLTLLTPPAASAASVNVTAYVRTADLMENAGVASLGVVFAYDSALASTPTLASVSPRSGFAGDELFIRGAGLGNITDSVSVAVGGVPCVVTFLNASTVVCTLGTTPAGTHRVLVTVAGKGFARGPAVRFTSLLEVTAQAGAVSGLGGGRLVTLTGRGFSASLTEVSVDACNARCTVLNASYTRLVCASGALVTRDALQALRIWTPSVLRPASTSVSAATDGSVESSFTACAVDVDLGPQVLGVISSVRLYPRFGRTASAQGATFLGRASSDANWTTLVTLSAWRVQEGWNEFNVGGYTPADNAASVNWLAQPAVRFLRFAFAVTGATCTANEVQFWGVPVSAAGSACPLNVTVAAQPARMAPFTGAVGAAAALGAPTTLAYDLAATAVITSVSPEFGSALGGETVTLHGSGFPAEAGDVSVVLNGVPCAVTSVSAAAVTCVTGARTAIEPLSINVTVLGDSSTGRALYDASRVYFRYLDRWSALTTWKYNEPPVEGDSVVVPPGQAILVDVSPPRLFLVLVQGDLVFARGRNGTFDAHYIFVHGGRFEVGTEARPFTDRLTITLHGDRRTAIEIPEVGAKMLTVMSRMDHSGGGGGGGMDMTSMGTGAQADGAPQQASTRGYSQGFLELHGIPRKRVWTRLGASIERGSSILTTAEDVDWAPGETLIVTNTLDYTLTEEVVVAEVLSPRALRLASPLANAHDCKTVPATQYGFLDVQLCAEVALLSRNVVVRGDESSRRQLYGMHMGAMHGGVFHVENVELTQCGQQGLLGRYCSHFHMVGDSQRSYVRFNSIHHSFQRAVTVHATNHASVRHNVAYDVFGHTIFVEDGVEKFNVIEENLVVHTKPCGMCISSDVKPANFWTASPTNFWRHNVGAGSTHFSFWFELPSSPHGPSFSTSVCPANNPLGEFFNNTAHSSGIGLRVYPQFFPQQAGCSGGGTLPAYFVNNTYFHNGQGMFHRNVGDLHHVNGRYVENWGEDVSWRKYTGVAYDWDPNLLNCLFVCSADPARATCGTRAITAPQNEFWYAANLTLVGYRAKGALAGCHSCQSDENFAQGGYTYRYAGLSWVNTTVRTFWNDPKKCIMWDLDGSLTGAAGGMVAPYYAFNEHPADGCSRDRSGTFGDATRCDGRHPIRRLQLDNFEPVTALQLRNINITTSAGWAAVQYRPKEFAGWSLPLVANRPANVSWVATLSDWQRLRVRYAEPEYVTDDAEHLVAGLSWFDYRWRVSARYGSSLSDPEIPALEPGARLDPAVHAFGVGTHPNGSAFNETSGERGAWSVLITPRNATKAGRDQLAFTAWAIQCPPWGCPMPPAPAVGDVPLLWSSPATWPAGRVPAAGDAVVINATSWVVLDVNPPVLGSLTIHGKLSFDDSGPRKLEAMWIVNWGNFSIGSPAEPFTNAAEVVLHGTRTSPTAVVDNSLFLGNKVLANLGTLSWTGRPVATPWTYLTATVVPGATTLVLAARVEGDWFPGQRLVISPTSYDTTEEETGEIASVVGATVTLTAPLLRRHYAGPAAANGTGAAVLLRAAVGLLSRNVVFRGNLTSGSDTYGGVLFTSVVTRGGVRRAGRVDARHVEFRATGKGGMEYPGLHFQYGRFLFDDSVPATSPRNYLEGVVVAGGFSHAIEAKAAHGLVINGSVLYRTYGNGITVDRSSTGFRLLNTLSVANLRPPNLMTDDQLPWHIPQAAVYVESVPAAMVGNLVAGAVDAGFTFSAPACRLASTFAAPPLGGGGGGGAGSAAAAAAGASPVSNNEAHSVRIGAWLLSTRAACVALDGLRVWKAAHVGILTVDQLASVVLRRVLVSDSHIGLSLNFYRPGTWREEGFSALEGATIIGTSLATDGCTENTVCRAAVAGDVRGERCGSVLGPSVRRAGLLMPQVTNMAKTCDVDADGMAICTPLNTPTRMCQLPWETRYGSAGSAHTGQYLTNVTFAGFGGAGAECGRDSTAIVWNPSQVDLAVPSHARGIVWDGVPPAARFDIHSNSATHAECADGRGCDATNLQHWRDLDGSLTGAGAGATLLGPNPLLALPAPACEEVAAWPGFVCRPTVKFAAASLTSVDRDPGALNLGALQVTRLAPGEDTWDGINSTRSHRTTLTRGSLKETCSMAGYWPQYPHIIAPNTGGVQHLYLPATEPGAFQYQLFSPDAAHAAVIGVSLQRSYAWEMWVQDCAACAPVGVPMLTPANRSSRGVPAETDAPGTWLFDPARRTLWFTVRGGAPTRTYRLVRTPAIQLTMHLAISVETFFADDLVRNLATLLGIPAGTIKVVDVRAGSVVTQLEIRDEQPTVLLNASDARASALLGGGGNSSAAANATAAAAAGNSTEAWDAQMARVGRLAARITALRDSGQLASIPSGSGSGSIPVLALEVEAPPEALAAAGLGAAPVTPPPNRAGGLTAGQAGGVAAGVVLAVALLAGLALVAVRRRQQQQDDAVRTMTTGEDDAAGDGAAGDGAKPARRGAAGGPPDDATTIKIGGADGEFSGVNPSFQPAVAAAAAAAAPPARLTSRQSQRVVFGVTRRGVLQ